MRKKAIIQALKLPLEAVTIIPTTNARTLAFASNDLRTRPNTDTDNGNIADIVHLGIE